MLDSIYVSLHNPQLLGCRFSRIIFTFTFVFIHKNNKHNQVSYIAYISKCKPFPLNL